MKSPHNIHEEEITTEEEINIRVEKFLGRVRHMLRFRSIEEQTDILKELRQDLVEHIRAHITVGALLNETPTESIEIAISKWASPEKIGLGYLRNLRFPLDVCFLDVFTRGAIFVFLAVVPLMCYILCPRSIMPVMLALTRIGAVCCMTAVPLLIGWHFGNHASNYGSISFQCLKRGDTCFFVLHVVAISGLMWSAIRMPVFYITWHGSLFSYRCIMQYVYPEANFAIGAGVGFFLMIAAASIASHIGQRKHAQIA